VNGIKCSNIVVQAKQIVAYTSILTWTLLLLLLLLLLSRFPRRPVLRQCTALSAAA
jgi:hypothetical protein